MPIMNTVIQGGGTTPTGTKSITSNGVYDVTDFASADVQVPTTAPELYRVFRSNNGKLENSITTPFLPLPNTITDIGDYCLYSCYFRTPSSVLYGAINLSSLTTISGSNGCNYMFGFCDGLTSVDLSSLTTISGPSACINMFNNCTSLTNVNLSSLTTISGNSGCNGMFGNCTSLTNVNLSSLTTISGTGACNYIFGACRSLTNVSFNSLNILTAQLGSGYNEMFYGCAKLETVEFGGLKSTTFASRKDQLRYLFNASTGSQATNGCTVHFPSNFDPSDPNHTFDASTLTGYPTFGGSTSYIHVAFDLPATES